MAAQKNGASIARRFCELVAIPSPSGQELETGRHIKKQLHRLGIRSNFDNSGSKNGSNSGNLIARINGSKHTKLMFIAHMDTVETGERRIKPLIRNGRITSDGKTILGADNKASVACLIEAMKEAISLKDRPDITCVFSTREEGGIMGAKFVDTSGIDYVFVLDGSMRPGIFTNGSLGYLPFEVRIFGKAAHAAVNPDDGANAIKAAGIFISNLDLGKDKSGATINIGRMEGGSRINVVPDAATMHGEVRGFTRRDMEKKFEHIERELALACSSTKCRYEIIKKKDNFLEPFLAEDKDDIISLAKRSALAAGLEFGLKKLSATCEANVLKSRNASVLGINRGGSGPHSKAETISSSDLEQLKSLIVEIIKNTD
ncbi:MAG: M20/M25/M40 family metallo-hydrolase [Candidatus Micrarchaeota archaeon]|nr:M20/M25/M40 family metallo-hydrolase [Candidatus Micrarchaeota archaeon]